MKRTFGRLSAAAMLTAAVMAVAAITGLPSASQAAGKYKIYLSMSYVGNDWQTESANNVKAMAQSAALKDKVQLEVQVAGPNAERQIQQINAMVQAGAQGIVIFPISPTALNQVVKNACDKGVVVFAYDAEITEPCAYNTHIDQTEAGKVTAEWLVKAMGGKGNVVVLTGVPGTSVDTQRTAAAMKVFKEHPDIHVVAQAVGMWSQAVARTELTKILATHPWNTINGLWLQVGCYTAASMQAEAGVPDEKMIPCAGEGSNGHRVQMLPKSAAGVNGANGNYRPMGYPSISYASPPYSGALALKKIVDILDGKTVPKLLPLPLPIVTNETSKLCVEGTWKEMASGCSAFQPELIKNPGWFAAIYSPETPEIGVQAALGGKPEM
jgi:ribose transport system substrate-binding protein